MLCFTEEMDQFLRDLAVVKNASEHTIRNYRLDLEGFKKFFQPQVSKDETPFSIGQIDKRSIRQYLAHQSALGSSKKTILRRLSTLRSFFKWLMKGRKITHNPLDEIESLKVEKKLPTSLSYAHVERLFEQPDLASYLGLRDRCILELFYSSALRLSELAGLNREDFDRRSLRIKVMGKGRKQRILPITQTAAHWLCSYLDHEERERDTEEHKAEADSERSF